MKKLSEIKIPKKVRMFVAGVVPCRSRVTSPGPGEPQGVLTFVVTQQLINQLKQLIIQLTLHLILILGTELVANVGAKKKPSTPYSAP